jgi:2-keto-4-pentenoate hydratase
VNLRLPSELVADELTGRAFELRGAEASGSRIAALGPGAMTGELAASIQQLNIDARTARGERIVGAKIALTTAAARARVGAAEPIAGWLTDAMALQDGDTVAVEDPAGRRAEVEMVFGLGADLCGPGVGLAAVLDATSFVSVGLDLPESRYSTANRSAADLVADNASAGRFAVAHPSPTWRAQDLALAGALMDLDGDVVATGAGAGVMGHPANAVAWLANHVAGHGRSLERGMVILTGGLTDPVTVVSGSTLEASIAGLGRLALRFR